MAAREFEPLELAAETAEMTKLLTSRACLYTLFHKLFGGVPTVELLDALESAAVQRALGAYAQESEPLRSAAEFFSGLRGRNGAVLLDQAKDEYTRLFIGPGELVAYPWEAPYVSKQPAVCQESTIAVREAYRAQGLEPRRLLRVPDDHVSLMCAFMAELGGRALCALDAGDVQSAAASLRAQESFSRGHMLDWLPEYARFARRSRTAVLYPQAIEAFVDFAALDAVFMSEAAFWLESLSDEERASLGGRAGIDADEGDLDGVRALRQAIERISALRLVGIEDNELVPTAA